MHLSGCQMVTNLWQRWTYFSAHSLLFLFYCNLFSLSCHSTFQQISGASIYIFEVYLFAENSESVLSRQLSAHSRIVGRSSQVLSLLWLRKRGVIKKRISTSLSIIYVLLVFFFLFFFFYQLFISSQRWMWYRSARGSRTTCEVKRDH